MSNRAHWPKTAIRVGFGLVWLADATLKWLPGFRARYTSLITGMAYGQPGWLKPWIRFWINLQLPRVMLFTYLVAVIETLLAIALILGFARKLTYIAAIVFMLLAWSMTGFGGPYTPGADNIGIAVIYVIVFFALLAFNYYEGTSRWSIDYLLEKRLGWWHYIAEVRSPNTRASNRQRQAR
jgi:nitrite reductase (NO-forming)